MDGKRNGFMDKILDTDGNGRHGYFDNVLDGQYADESDNEKIFYDEECGDIDSEYCDDDWLDDDSDWLDDDDI